VTSRSLSTRVDSTRSVSPWRQWITGDPPSSSGRPPSAPFPPKCPHRGHPRATRVAPNEPRGRMLPLPTRGRLPRPASLPALPTGRALPYERQRSGNKERLARGVLILRCFSQTAHVSKYLAPLSRGLESEILMAREVYESTPAQNAQSADTPTSLISRSLNVYKFVNFLAPSHSVCYNLACDLGRTRTERSRERGNWLDTAD
jgi:hypothetical protein